MFETLKKLLRNSKVQDVIDEDMERLGICKSQADELDVETSHSTDSDSLSIGYAEGQTFGIEYEDSKGNLSQRYVTCYDIVPGANGVPLLTCKCHSRNRTRQFRIDRIKSIFDAEGELFEVPIFLMENFGMDASLASCEASLDTEWKEIRPLIHKQAILLAALGLADGRLCSDELDIITRHLANIATKAGFVMRDFDVDKLQKFIKRLKPTAHEAFEALWELCGDDPNCVGKHLRMGMDVIKADGVICDAEANLLSDLSEDITGHDIMTSIDNERFKLRVKAKVFA